MLRKISSYLRWFESAILVVLFLALLLVAVLQVVLRNVGQLSLSLSWGDEFMSMAVLWLTLVGALIAVRQNGHIRLDVAERFLPHSWSKPLSIFANLAACFVCLVVAFFSIEWVVWEFQDQIRGIGVVPLWILVSIVPISFFVMGLRFAMSIFVKSEE